ncbi:alpha/beta hydrolase [Adhaeribacter aquaticus]|uniref:alpha/beta hydrolase n=1 Tax=Adhaeribacter aquaticus TaxID=299567 RepID=UPI0004196082|nr:alpha/beta hydrolase-fold protein [Adhaeribacter aquaticus]
MKSKLLGTEVKYTIYLPADYNTSQRNYPVVYLLHGGGDDDTGWVQFGEIQRYADQAIASGEIPPMIIITPDAKRTYYINDYQGKVRYEDMFVQELIPFIDSKYRTRPEKRYRGISGLSMGGYGALMYSMRHPELFSSCAAFSAAVRTDEEIASMEANRYETGLGKLFGEALQKEARLTPHYRQYSILDIIKTKPVEELKKVKYYLDCGDDDFLTIGNALLHAEMTKYSIPHEFRVRDGAHTWTYWRTGIINGLKFIGDGFRQI